MQGYLKTNHVEFRTVVVYSHLIESYAPTRKLQRKYINLQTKGIEWFTEPDLFDNLL
jgi:hypothetical protein